MLKALEWIYVSDRRIWTVLILTGPVGLLTLYFYEKWRQGTRSVAIGVDVAADGLTSLAIARTLRDGTVRYSVEQVARNGAVPGQPEPGSSL